MPKECVLWRVSLVLCVLVTAALAAGCDLATQIDRPYHRSEPTPTPDTTPPDPPQVDPVYTPTTLEFQSITGSAEAGATVRVAGGLAPAERPADANGRFCVAVNLKPDAVNNLSVTARDEAGNVSEPTARTIRQEGEVNYALNGEPSASSTSHSKPGNSPDKANDANYQTFWENTTQPWFPECLRQPQWLAIDLKANYWISQVDVFWGEDLSGTYEYATKFDVYVNDREELTKLPHEVDADELADYGYTRIKHFDQPANAGTTQNSVDRSDNPIEARWVLLLLYEGNQTGVLPGPDGQTLYSYEVAELEIYGAERLDSGCE